MKKKKEKTSTPTATKIALDNVGFKIDHGQWEAALATASQLGISLADLFRAGAEQQVKKAGLFAWPDVDPAVYKRGRPAKTAA